MLMEINFLTAFIKIIQLTIAISTIIFRALNIRSWL